MAVDYKLKFKQLRAEIDTRQAYEEAHPELFAVNSPHHVERTGLDWTNVDDESLLVLSVQLNDIHKVQRYHKTASKEQKLQAMLMALQLGFLDVADFLLQKDGTYCASIELSDIKNPEGRVWFQGHLVEVLKLHALPYYKKIFLGETLPSSSTVEEYAATVVRLIEIGDDDGFRQYLRKHPNISLHPLLILAATNGRTSIIKILLEMKGDINTESLYQKSPLLAAAKYDHQATVHYLIQNGAHVNYPGKHKITALMYAARNNNVAMLSALLVAGANLKLKDVQGRNALHYAVSTGSVDAIHKLLEYEYIASLVNDADIYGETPYDMALRFGRAEIVALLDLRAPVIHQQQRIDSISLHQSDVLKKMSYYLRSQYRETQLFDHKGVCNGLIFLFHYYSFKNMQSYFYDTLKLLSSWDGSHDSLQMSLAHLPQGKYYKNLQELFEGWINDVMWFQHYNVSDQVTKMLQHERTYQLSVVQENDDIQFDMISSYGADLNRNQLIELLAICLQRMPPGSRFNLSGGAHVTGGFVDHENQFSYFDANLEAKVSNTADANKLATTIIDTKLIMLDQPVTVFDCLIDFFKFSHANQVDNLQHEAFKSDEIPKNKEDIRNFQKKSPNHFTQLHVAVMAGSYASVMQLLQTGLFDLDVQDAHEFDVTDIASVTNNPLIVSAISNYANEQRKPQGVSTSGVFSFAPNEVMLRTVQELKGTLTMEDLRKWKPSTPGAPFTEVHREALIYFLRDKAYNAEFAIKMINGMLADEVAEYYLKNKGPR